MRCARAGKPTYWWRRLPALRNAEHGWNHPTQFSLPPTARNSGNPDITWVSSASLYQVSKYNTGDPHFGRTGDGCFDNAQPDVTKRLGTCYLGFNFTVAFAESVLHNVKPDAVDFRFQ